MALRTQVSPYVLLGDSLADLPDPGSVAQGMLFHEDATGQGRVLVIDPATGLRTWEPFNAPAGPTGATGATGPAPPEVLVAPAVDEELVVALPDVTTQPDGALTLYVLSGTDLGAAVGVLTAAAGQTVGVAGLDWYRLYEGGTVLLRATPGAARWDVAGEARDAPSTSTRGVNFYADAAAGDDANPGTAARPVRTLRRAEQLFAPAGVTAVVVRLAPGEYGDPAGILQLGGPYPAGPSGTPLVIAGAFRDAGYGPQVAQPGSGGHTLVTSLDLPPGTDLAGTFVALPNSGSADLRAVARNTTGPGATLTLVDAVVVAPGDPFELREPAVDITCTPIVSGTRLVGVYGVRFRAALAGAVAIFGGTLYCDSCVFAGISVAITRGTLVFAGLATFPSPWTGGATPPGSAAALAASVMLLGQAIVVGAGSAMTGSLVARAAAPTGPVLQVFGHSAVALDFIDATGGGIFADASTVDIVGTSPGSPAMRVAAGPGGIALRALRGAAVAATSTTADGIELSGDTGVQAAQDSAVKLANAVLAGCATAGIALATGSALDVDRVRCTGCGVGVALDQSVANLNDLTATGSAGHGVVVANNARAILASCTVSANGGDGVHAANGGNGAARDTVVSGNAGHGVALSGGCQFDLANLSGAGNGGYGLDVEYRSGATAAGCAAAGAAGEVRLGAAGPVAWAAVQNPDGANDLAPVAPFTVAQLCFASEP